MNVGKMFERKGFTVIYQHRLGPYKLDIFLPEINTIIEIYGSHHVISYRIERDKIRTKYITDKGYRLYIIKAQDTYNPGFIRNFSNEIIKENQRAFKYKNTAFNNVLSAQLKKVINYS